MTSLDEIRKRDVAHWPWHDAPQQTVTGSVAIHDRRELLATVDDLFAEMNQGWPKMTNDANRAAIEAMTEIDNLKERLRALHVDADPAHGHCIHCRRPWPCPTICAVDAQP